LIVSLSLSSISIAACTPGYIERLTKDASRLNPDGTSDDLDALLSKASNDQVLYVLWHTHAQLVREDIYKYIADPTKFTDENALHQAGERLVTVYGDLGAAQLFVLRGDKFAFVILLGSFRRLEEAKEHNSVWLKTIAAFGAYLQEIGAREFTNSQELSAWMSKELPSMEFDISTRSPRLGLPQLRPVSSATSGR
jgi:hypothetical protein